MKLTATFNATNQRELNFKMNNNNNSRFSNIIT